MVFTAFHALILFYHENVILRKCFVKWNVNGFRVGYGFEAANEMKNG